MNAPKDNDARTRLWIALGNQPGVSAAFAVWSLSQASLRREPAPRKITQPVPDSCHNPAKGSPA